MPQRGDFTQNNSPKHPSTEEKLTRPRASLAHNEHYCTPAAIP